MQKNLFFSSLFVLLTSSAIGQSTASFKLADVKEFSPVSLPSKTYELNNLIIDHDNDALIFPLRSKTGFGFIKVNSNMEKVSESYLEKPKSKYLLYEDFFDWKGNVYILASDYDKKSKEEILNFVELKFGENDFQGINTEILRHSGKLAGEMMPTGFYSAYTLGKFQVLNEDKWPYMGVWSKPVKSDNPDGTKRKLYLLDSKLKVASKVELNVEGKLLSHTMHGDYFYIMTIDNPEEDREKDKKTALHVYQVHSKTKKVKSVSYNFENNIVSSGLINHRESGKTDIVGYYYDKNSRGLMGTYTLQFDLETMKAGPMKFYPFARDLVRQNESEKTINRADKMESKGKEMGVHKLIPRSFLQRSDGGFYLVGEQYRMIVSMSSSSNGVSYKYYYSYEDEYISSFDSSGNELWVRKLPKKQYFANYSEYGGISSFIYNDNVYIFRLDLIENKDLGDREPVKIQSFKGSSLVLSKISKEGKVETEYIMHFNDRKANVLPRYIWELSPGKLFTKAKESAQYYSTKDIRPIIIDLK